MPGQSTAPDPTPDPALTPDPTPDPALTPDPTPAFGIYLHIPFCRHRCDYCAFATFTDRDHLMESYVDACATELERAEADEGIPPATSVFVGGGTPSRLAAPLLADLLERIPRRPGCEVTVECNPEDVDATRLATYRAAGVTRISLGVQSTVPHVLHGLGRRHGSDQASRAAALVADGGFRSWNVDLIAGGSGEEQADWRQTLLDVLAWPVPPPHISAYSLTVEPGTPLAHDASRHPQEDDLAARYALTEQILSEAGFVWEEISNWSRPGHGCRHNRLYWTQGEYRGIGSAAHSHRQGRRWWNVRTPERYCSLIRSGRSATSSEEVLTEEQRRFEALVLALRTPLGVPDAALPLEVLPADLGLDDLVVRSNGRAVLTVRGRLLADAVAARLVDPGPQWSPEPPPSG